MGVLGNEGLVEGIVGSSTGLFKVIHGEITFQLSHFWFHLLRVRFTLMSCQWFLSQDELIQLVSDIKIGAVLLQLIINNVTWEKKREERTDVWHVWRIELLRLQFHPINLREPTVRPELINARETRSAT